MKIWVRTSIIGAGTTEDPRRPDIPGGLPYSMVDLGDGTCVARVAGPYAQVSALTPITDDEARTLIKGYNPSADLFNCDVPDPELNDLAKTLGIDPLEVRRRAPITTPFALQSQEAALLEEVTGRRDVDISANLDRIKEGRSDEHGKALEKLRK